LYLPLA